MQAKLTTRLCAHCGQVFHDWPSSTHRFCSWDCFQASLRPKVTRTCEQCGKQWQVHYSAQHRRFCSRVCFLEATRFSLEASLSRYAVAETGCHLWAGSLYSNGYGRIQVTRGKHRLVHRVAWEVAHPGEPIPGGIQVCHSCDVLWPDLTYRRCMNAEHLFLGTAAENMADAKGKGRMPSGNDHWMHRMPEHARFGGPEGPRPRGATHGNSSLTEAQVIEARRLMDSGVPIAEVASEQGISIGALKHIRARRTWKHLD